MKAMGVQNFQIFAEKLSELRSLLIGLSPGLISTVGLPF
jgi:hypothetical protein